MYLCLDRADFKFYFISHKIGRNNKMFCDSYAFEGAPMISDCRMPRGILKTN